MKFTDRLLLKTPAAPTEKLGGGKKSAKPGEISTRRIILSLVGILLGIIASFYVTGLRPSANANASTARSTQQAETATSKSDGSTPTVVSNFSLKRLATVSVIALVICGLSYHGLFYSLRLYQNEPTFLIIFVSFQYGYFWQSVVQGAAALAGS